MNVVQAAFGNFRSEAKSSPAQNPEGVVDMIQVQSVAVGGTGQLKEVESRADLFAISPTAVPYS